MNIEIFFEENEKLNFFLSTPHRPWYHRPNLLETFTEESLLIVSDKFYLKFY